MSTNYEKGFNNLPDLKNHPAGDYMGGDWPSKFNIIFDDFTSFDTASNGWRVGTNASSTVALVPTSQFDSSTANGVLRLTTSASATGAAGSCLLAWAGGSGANRATMPFTGTEPFFWQIRYKYPANATDCLMGFSMSEQTLLTGSQYTGFGFIHPSFQTQFNPNSGSPAGSFLRMKSAIVGAFGHLDGTDEITTLDRYNVLTFYYDPKRKFMVYQINDKRYDAAGTLRAHLDGQELQNDSSTATIPFGSDMMPTIGLSGAVSQSIDIDYVMCGYGRPEEQF
tara:strand:+ start:8009 stop:8851 length:843 start_codon:yes stop_codon:yes gene_type:complete